MKRRIPFPLEALTTTTVETSAGPVEIEKAWICTARLGCLQMEIIGSLNGREMWFAVRSGRTYQNSNRWFDDFVAVGLEAAVMNGLLNDEKRIK